MSNADVMTICSGKFVTRKRPPGSAVSLPEPVPELGRIDATSKRAAGSRIADERLQSVIELAVDFYWEQDAQHRFTVYRPSGEPDVQLSGLLGKTSAEFFQELAETDGRESLAAALRRAEHVAGVRDRVVRELAERRRRPEPRMRPSHNSA